MVDMYLFEQLLYSSSSRQIVKLCREEAQKPQHSSPKLFPVIVC